MVECFYGAISILWGLERGNYKYYMYMGLHVVKGRNDPKRTSTTKNKPNWTFSNGKIYSKWIFI